jgi:predicted porin
MYHESVRARCYNLAVARVSNYSRRTDAYILGTWQKASGISSTGAPAVANVGNLGDSSNNRQAVVRLGLRHKF